MKKSNLDRASQEFSILRWFILAIVILVVVFVLIPNFSHPDTAAVTFPDQTVITVDLARTPAEQALGLSGRAGLVANHGLLFPYDEPKLPTFWMRGMNFSIDIIWLLDGRIVDLDENLPLDTQTYTPAAPVNQVLEVAAGFARAHNLTIGNQLTIRLP
ncbi:DUF192 domain-containing protein [Patescibacteria group bacterium]|nr:DUF192 domain-containing protein [Patescibacteria group bacterium]MBU1705921.1 DUF192 domain-containing protein [Patescibacteria group bacterium]